MKKTVFILFAITVNVCYAQEDNVVTEKLKQHYSEVIYHNDHDGWYSLRMGNKNCKACIGACDKLGYEMIPCIYDDVVGFVSAGYFQVKRNNKFYAIPLSEKKLLIQADAGFSDFARKYVEPKAENVPAGISDVAVNIPVTNIKNDKTFAVIIANENYRRESQVEFAKNDGETFWKYCIQTLGMPEINVHFTTNATFNDIRIEIDWLSNVAEAFNSEANIIFYYAGHGIPDENTKSACLLPVDGIGTNVNSAYKLDDLYQTLGKMPAKTVTAFIDACFSGTHRSGDMMTSARGVAIKIDTGAPAGNTVVFSAAQGIETAYSYPEKGHGLFTYFLLKKLQETNGEVTLGELDDYIAGNVRRHSIIVNKKTQTPAVTPSATLGTDWRNRKLK